MLSVIAEYMFSSFSFGSRGMLSLCICIAFNSSGYAYRFYVADEIRNNQLFLGTILQFLSNVHNNRITENDFCWSGIGKVEKSWMSGIVLTTYDNDPGKPQNVVKYNITDVTESRIIINGPRLNGAVFDFYQMIFSILDEVLSTRSFGELNWAFDAESIHENIDYIKRLQIFLRNTKA
jgi:hypothetical protein